MRIIGIGYLSESSVCYIDNGKIKFAMSEERINRIKNFLGDIVLGKRRIGSSQRFHVFYEL